MSWKDFEIERLRKSIRNYEEWLVERAEFTRNIKKWLSEDKTKMEELQK